MNINTHYFYATIFSLIISFPLFAQQKVNVTIDVNSQTHSISPYIYGKNNSFSDNANNPLGEPEWQRLKDAGITFFRESGGNNCTKYNWRKHLSSHPDWYNNVYYHNWDYAAQSLQENIPYAQGMWAFQLLGKVAKTDEHNFNDWGYNNSQWWEGVNQNLAGGGEPDESGGHEAKVEGDPDLYLQDWPADSTVAILDHWFNDDELGFDEGNFLYWNMDNEAEIWSGTHDDVMPEQLSAEAFMQKYFKVAKKAREKFPDIKICGPVTANEWQWYNWDGGLVTEGGKQYPWLEFFIKRVAEEQKATGMKLLDVLDIHFYPGTNDAEEAVQLHRVYFDRDYDFPGANGIKKINGGWDESITKEYILGRCLDWLEEYMGPDHGVKLGITETGINPDDPDVVAVWYASTLGEFMRHKEMEIFTPWYWKNSMWEVVHMFSQYHNSLYVSSTSENEELVSAYTTTDASGDSLTVTLVNRSVNDEKNVNVKFSGFIIDSKEVEVLTLSDLPTSLTFKSDEDNALKSSTVDPAGSSIQISMAPMSISTFRVKGHEGETVTALDEWDSPKQIRIYPNPTSGQLHIGTQGNKHELILFDVQGHEVIHEFSSDKLHTIDVNHLNKGLYVLHIQSDARHLTRKIVVN